MAGTSSYVPKTPDDADDSDDTSGGATTAVYVGIGVAVFAALLLLGGLIAMVVRYRQNGLSRVGLSESANSSM